MSISRTVFLWASTNPWLRERAVRTRFVKRSVVKFMPGEHLEDAIEAAKRLKPVGITTILTRLGENITDISEADEVCDALPACPRRSSAGWARCAGLGQADAAWASTRMSKRASGI